MDFDVFVHKNNKIAIQEIERVISDNNITSKVKYNVIGRHDRNIKFIRLINFYERLFYKTCNGIASIDSISNSDFVLDLYNNEIACSNGIFDVKINGINFSDEFNWYKNVITTKSESVEVTYGYRVDNNTTKYRFIIRPDNIFLFPTRNEILNKLVSICVERKPLGEIIDYTVINSSKKYNNFTFFTILIKNLFKKIYYKVFFNQQWFIQYKLNKEDAWINLFPPKDRFWADPFLIKNKGKHFLFVEELIYSKGYAHLSVMEVGKNGIISNPKIILDKGFHMSYPYVFKVHDKFYMIPETSKSKTIQLYQSNNFPYEWKFCKNLVENVYASDSSIVRYNDIWWLFTSEKKMINDSYDTYLSIYYSDDLISGNWEKHKQNPVRTDVSESRCGGYLYEKNGILYRVSQNCSKCYGYGYNITKITNLTVDAFDEEVVSRVTAEQFDKDIVGIHTYSLWETLETRDLLRMCRK